MDQGVCGTCPICLGDIRPEDEAFLDTCFHSACYKCIKQWTYTQRRHPPAKGPLLTCPLCKQGYYSLIYDCHGDAFRREQVAEPPRGARLGPPTATSAHLTSAHRRRRSVYHSPPDAAGQAALAGALLTLRQADRADVQRWVVRELQALMWQDNVDLIAQHVLGTLHSTVQAGGSASAAAAAAGAPKQQRAATAGGAGRGATASAPVLLKRKALALGTQSRGRAAGSGATAEAVAAAVGRAAEPYVFDRAERFGLELAAFVASGSTVAAYDREHRAQPSSAAAAAAADWQEGEARAEAAAERGPEGPSSGAQQASSNSGGGGGGYSSNGGEGFSEREEEGEGYGTSCGGGALARSDSDEGYLELLLAQGRPRRRVEPATDTQRDGPEAAAAAACPEGREAAGGTAGPVAAAKQPADGRGNTAAPHGGAHHTAADVDRREGYREAGLPCPVVAATNPATKEPASTAQQQQQQAQQQHHHQEQQQAQQQGQQPSSATQAVGPGSRAERQEGLGPVGELEGYRSRALAALQRHRQSGKQEDG